ncbi:hypothetical protein YpMG051020_3656 [Yersinia pestis biovar Orientalis str. MG05-1020]|uniref:Uncharacterized protein n=1 Tax=Yersinia pestis biovar Orientalis str. IP275 TaxID=373665 RepID=A0AAV3BA32_YERPE|nr:hypothetical protein YPIP275_2172 [Yersinia pestis biovar Orientalis str. IP275]EDR42538.1 hypothetical protein YpE1979001_4320 [Yersinia pestis biovar Antiqua str. E1979001]EDR57738.1 hypothetical protein YpMG051020_3656 [Yersinia pestis biovar Orientalis str. MG05-1020]
MLIILFTASVSCSLLARSIIAAFLSVSDAEKGLIELSISLLGWRFSNADEETE